MPMTDHHTWHVKIHRPGFTNVSLLIHRFRCSGFVVSSLPGHPESALIYSLQHSSKHAMTLFMLKQNCAGFTVTSEWHNA
jgi:hypothetical protein